MAAANMTLSLSNGQVLSVYLAAGQAVGTNPVCSLEAVASATVGVTDFTPRTDCFIVDKVNGTSTTGQMEVYNVSRGVRTGRVIDQTTQAVSVVNRMVERIGFKGGQTYRFIQTVLQS